MNQTVLKKKKTFIGMVKWCSPYVTKHNIRQCDFVCKKKKNNNKSGVRENTGLMDTTTRGPLLSNSGNKCRKINNGKALTVTQVDTASRSRRARS